MRPDHAELAQTWGSMISRCYNQEDPGYKNYGGRGIRVAEGWHSFQSFAGDMAPRPIGMSLDRINVNGHYSKDNCRWATATEQQRNRSDTVRLTIDGETKTLYEWAESSGTKHTVIRERIRLGWDHKKAVFGSGYALHEIRGESRTIKGWAKHIGISYTAVRNRISKGWSIDRALLTPTRQKSAV